MGHSRTRQTRAAVRSQQCGRRKANRRDQARQLCQWAAETANSLHLEMWVSWFLGQLWIQREKVPDDYPDGYELALGGSLIEDIAGIGGPRARVALTAIARFDRGDLGTEAFMALCRLPDGEVPEHVRDVGRMTVTGARSIVIPGDGEAFLIEAEAPDETRHAVGGFINEARGGIVTTMGLVRGFDEIDALHDGEVQRGIDDEGPWDTLRYSPCDPSGPCRRLREALQLTDCFDDPPVNEAFPHLRALAYARACALV